MRDATRAPVCVATELQAPAPLHRCPRGSSSTPGNRLGSPVMLPQQHRVPFNSSIPHPGESDAGPKRMFRRMTLPGARRQVLRTSFGTVVLPPIRLPVLQMTMWHMAVWLSIIGGDWRVSPRDSVHGRRSE